MVPTAKVVRADADAADAVQVMAPARVFRRNVRSQPLRVPIRTGPPPLRVRRTDRKAGLNADPSVEMIVRTPVRNAHQMHRQATQQTHSRVKGASAADAIDGAAATATAVANSRETAKLLREHLRLRAKVHSRNAPDLPDRPSRSVAISQSPKRKSAHRADRF